jgi:hypothetical protein
MSGPSMPQGAVLHREFEKSNRFGISSEVFRLKSHGDLATKWISDSDAPLENEDVDLDVIWTRQGRSNVFDFPFFRLFLLALLL